MQYMNSNSTFITLKQVLNLYVNGVSHTTNSQATTGLKVGLQNDAPAGNQVEISLQLEKSVFGIMYPRRLYTTLEICVIKNIQQNKYAT